MKAESEVQVQHFYSNPWFGWVAILRMTASEFFMKGYNTFQVTKESVFKEETTIRSLQTSRETAYE